MKIIEAHGLTKKYGDLTAVDSLDLSVDKEIYGLLGPNGSGKTTTVNMLTSLLLPTSGTATICGHDIISEKDDVRRSMSYVPQYLAVDIRLTGRENVDLYAKLYGIKNKTDRKESVERVLDVMGLTERADEITRSYSGGMQRRLELAQALVHDPKVLFLDEPTMGLDVSARRSIWTHISKLKDSGMAVFVTTHHMDEAEKYCDRVGILKKGVLVTEGTPSELKSSKRSIISIKTDGGPPSSIPEEAELLNAEGDEVIFSAENGHDALLKIIHNYDRDNIKIYSATLREPSLEDVYLISVDSEAEESGRFNRMQFRNIMRRN